MRRVQMTLSFLVASCALLAQTPRFSDKRPIHIDGTVVEKESRAPIANAKVTLVATENSDEQRTTSDANGRFSFDTIEPVELGLPLQVRAEIPGYLPALPDAAGSDVAGMLQSMGGGALRITRDKRNYVAELNMSRAATLSGVLIDVDSKEPLAKLAVSAQRRVYRRGEATYDGFGGSMPVITGADGSFQFAGLTAGDYVLQVLDPLKPKIEALPSGQPPAPAEGARGYGNVILPGATANYPEFASIPVRAGATVDIGNTALHQQRLRNYAGTFDSDCKDSERVTLYLETVPRNTGPSNSQVIPCGPFRITNVPEGTFAVAAWVLGGSGGGFISQPLELRSSDPIHLRVQPRGAAHGTLEVEDASSDQFPKDLEGIYVGLNPKSMPYLQGDTLTPPSVNGKFTGIAYSGATYEIAMRLPEAYYIKRLFYNNVEQPDPIHFTATSGVTDHLLRIVLSPHPATFQAQVDAGSTVLLIPDGLDPARRYSERIALTSAAQQKAVMKRGLRPGTYHAFAIPTASLPALEVPGAIDKYLTAAQTVHLEEGQTSAVSFVSP